MRVISVVLIIFLIAVLEAVVLDHTGNSPEIRWLVYGVGCLLVMLIVGLIKQRDARQSRRKGGQG